MRKVPIILGIVLVISLLYAPVVIPAQVEWTIGGQIDLKAPTLDMCASADGKWLYILSAGEVAIYSFAEERVVNRIAVDKVFDRMTYVKEKNSIVVTSRSGNQLQMIQLEVVYQFDNSGLPYQGSKRAPITIAVFSDYQ
jgi:protein-disulfide isomerase